MAEVPISEVRLSDEELATGRVFWERDFRHEQANPEWEDGEVWIADEGEYQVARTSGVVQAVRNGRLIELDQGTLQVGAEEIDATDSARELAEEHDIDLATIAGSGQDGRIIKADVQAEVDRLSEE